MILILWKIKKCKKESGEKQNLSPSQIPTYLSPQSLSLQTEPLLTKFVNLLEL